MERAHKLILAGSFAVWAWAGYGLWDQKAVDLASEAVVSIATAGPPEFKARPVVIQRGARSGRRIYLFPGLRTGNSYWRHERYQWFLQERLSAGDELVFLELPYAEAGLWRDGGTRYCAAFARWLRETDASLPPARSRIAFGVSYGGLHAALASALLPTVDGYVALMPVTDIRRLSEFRLAWNNRCDQVRFAGELKPGVVIYGDLDHRVGSDAISATVAATGAESIVFEGVGHRIVPAMLEGASEWIDQR